MTGERIRLLVVDDQAIVRDGLVTVLSLVPDFEVVGEASDGGQAVRLAASLHPDVILMDLRMPGVDGVEATTRILAEHPATAVLVLTTHADDESILGALRAGARGYLTKDAGRAEVAHAIRTVALGQTLLAPAVSEVLVGSLTGRHVGTVSATPAPLPLSRRFPALTAREREVLELVGQGLSNTEIAERLVVGMTTVKTHINAIFAKLGVRDRAQAITLVRS
ncbi:MULTISPECIES: response regulator [Oerskovia]|uniref:Response regulator transcription factor n=2 Tax=Oerskovia TaxID=162491 RepID=A0ABR8V6E6_9CELL|nr:MULTISPECIES: response regulator transcription factor [Oerskovia]MBD8000161.1 response regulator transcription factor [Oerskovia gallyi]MBM7496244.1 DNA-binding NarL/FixJ family response regulator [Oerskovia paurometabola]